MALDMALKCVIAIPQKGFDEDGYHAVMQATARKDIITFVAALLKTGAAGSRGEGILPNMRFDEIESDDYDAIAFLSGGAGAYYGSPLALGLAKEFYEKGKVVAAIGDAMPILENAGLLNGRKVACDEAHKDTVSLVAECVDENVFADERIITARSGSGMEFGERLGDALNEIGIRPRRKKGIEL